MKKRQIGIIGTGNLGIRHLQAVALLKESCRINVMDISKEALQNAKAVWRETEGAKNHEISFVTEMASMPKELDAVIVATVSHVRKKVIEELLSHARVRYLILEKVLFQRLEDYGAVRELMEKNQVQAFVNCPRRMYPVYEKIKKKLERARTMEIMVSGSDWHLGCNGIHMLDLIGYLAGTEQITAGVSESGQMTADVSGSEQITLDISGLEPECLPSTRKGFSEIAGTIRGSLGRCRAFSLASYPQKGIPASTVILSDVCWCRILEGKRELDFADASTGWEWKKETFEMPYQSRLTNLALEELFAGGSCRLTAFEESCRLHIALEEQLIPWFEKRGKEKGLCPIT